MQKENGREFFSNDARNYENGFRVLTCESENRKLDLSASSCGFMIA